MSNKNLKKFFTFGIRWDGDKKAAFEAFAARWPKDPSVLAREVLEEFMACYLDDSEVMRLGMVAHLGKRGSGWLEAAKREAEKISSTQQPTELPDGATKQHQRKRAS